jgi:hypothetical protein
VVWFAVGGPGAVQLGALPVLRQVPPHRVVFLLPLLVGWLAALALDQPLLGWRRIVVGLSVLLLLAAGASLAAWNPQTAAGGLFWWDAAFSAGLLLAAAGALVLRSLRPQWRTPCDWLVVALVFINLASYGRDYNPAGPVAQLFPPTPVTDYLEQVQDITRAAPLQQGSALLFGPNAITDYGVLQPGGYSSLVLGAYYDLISRGDPVIAMPWIDRSSNFVLLSEPSARLLDLLNVNLLVSPVELADPGPVAEFVGGPCHTALPLTGATPLAGEFTVWHSALNRLDIPLAPAPVAASASAAGASAAGAGAAGAGAAGAGAAVRLQLWRDGPGGVLIVDIAAPVEELLPQPQWTVYFAPEDDAPGRRYAWKLTMEGQDAGTGAGTGSSNLRLCAGPDGSPAFSAYGPRQAPVELPPDNGVRLYRRFAPFPRAAVVYAAETVGEQAVRLDRLLNPDFDARNIALAEVPLALPAVPPIPATRAEIAEYGNQRVVITATAQLDGLLVLADQYDAGWTAAVDGVPTPVLRVNHFMRGVPLPAGPHTVVFTFAPRSLQLGAGLAVLGLGLAGLLAVLDWRERTARRGR